MKPLSYALLMSLLVAASGCSLVTPTERRHLHSAQGQATQEVEPGSQDTWASAGSWCDEYALTFDKGGVLREWTPPSFSHAGEKMPVSCNSVLGVSRPAL